jgi:REP element-mobilizing transposase RayT
MPNHFHILIGQKPNVALSDLVRHIKTGSSGFINDRRWAAGRFSWQEGFGAFSYSHSQLSSYKDLAPTEHLLSQPRPAQLAGRFFWQEAAPTSDNWFVRAIAMRGE